MTTVAELVKELRNRSHEIMPELNQLRQEFPSIRDDQRLAWMYLRLKDTGKPTVISPKVVEETLTDLMYSQDRKGPFRLYILDKNGMHTGGQWFREKPVYKDEEITSAEARDKVGEAMDEGLEVRICDGGDMLVYHSIGSTVLYPKPLGMFWTEIGAYPPEGYMKKEARNAS